MKSPISRTIAALAFVAGLAAVAAAEDPAAERPSDTSVPVPMRETDTAAPPTSKYVPAVTTEQPAPVPDEASRRAYEEKAQVELNHLENLIHDLELRARDVPRTDRDQADAAVTEVRDRRDVARAALADLQASAPERWESLRDRADAALDDLRESYDRARDRLP
jgi:hypothetical protein